MESGPKSQMLDLVATRHVIVCCGSGGVGKTTSAAVMALEAARLGRRAVVVTIDPAKRLADALGLGGLTNTPARIDGEWPGEMWAMMLDTEATFNDLVARYAGSTEQADKILANRFYRNISSAMSGTQEYMASEKLFELATNSDFDLIVVDTPPTRNALDFLEAPNRLARFLDHRLYRMVTAPTRGLVKAVNVATQGFFRSVGKVVGGEVIADAIAFFAAFDGMEEGFKARAREVDRLLRDDDTAFGQPCPSRPRRRDAGGRRGPGRHAGRDTAGRPVQGTRRPPDHRTQRIRAPRRPDRPDRPRTGVQGALPRRRGP